MFEDHVLLLLATLIPLWHGVALVELARSRRKVRAKLGWMAAVLLLPPFGLFAWALRGRERHSGPARGFGLYMSLALVLVAGLLAATRPLWQAQEGQGAVCFYLAWWGAWSLVTLAMYAADKRASRAGKDARGRGVRARVPERVLHTLALVGGFAGGWIGRQVIRHKSNKAAFFGVLLVATGVHLLAAGAQLSKLLGLW